MYPRFVSAYLIQREDSWGVVRSGQPVWPAGRNRSAAFPSVQGSDERGPVLRRGPIRCETRRRDDVRRQVPALDIERLAGTSRVCRWTARPTAGGVDGRTSLAHSRPWRTG